MDPTAVLLALFAVGVAIGFAVLMHQRQREAVEALADALGLEERHEGFGSKGWTLNGDWRGVPVQVRFWMQGNGKSSSPRTTARLTGVDPALAIAHQGLLTDLLGVGGPDLETGDPAFDQRVVLAGPERTLRGRLDAETRAGLEALDRAGDLKVRDGEVEVNRRGHLFKQDELARLLDDMARVTERLKPRPVTDDDLLALVRADPMGGVRLRTALHLLERADAPLRQRIIGALGRAFPAAAALSDAIAGDGPALDAAPRVAVEEIAALAPIGVCRLLERARAEGALIGLLSSEDNGVRLAAAQSLGAMGTVRAVEPLMPLTEGLLASGDLKRVARQAITEIQGRLGPVSAGSLSVAEGGAEAGRLSVAGAAGALSTPKVGQ